MSNHRNRSGEIVQELPGNRRTHVNWILIGGLVFNVAAWAGAIYALVLLFGTPQ